MSKKIFITLICFVFFLSFAGMSVQNAAAAGEKSLIIAYQGGIGYAPVHVMEVQQLIEKNYSGEISVNFIKLDSGAAISEGIIG